MLWSSDADGLVSVVVPTYRRNDRLRETLASVAAQEYRPIETVVVDGADDDRARPVVAEFPDATYVSQPAGDDGPQAARSLGVERARITSRRVSGRFSAVPDCPQSTDASA